MKSNRRRKPLRADWWDYSLSAGYFLTLCTKDREHHFGYIANGKMNLSEIGVIARHRWQDIPHYFPFSSLGEFVIMPGHIHGIITLDNPVGDNPVGSRLIATLPGGFAGSKNPMFHQNISRIIRWFKGRVCYESRKINPQFAWQS